tara:strand:+ start:206 stop:421 length:216 start_codon:yes stop_codon:yes gene_type:complete
MSENLNNVERDPIDSMYLDIMEILKQKHKDRKLMLPKEVKKIVDVAYHNNAPDEDLFEEEVEESENTEENE